MCFLDINLHKSELYCKAQKLKTTIGTPSCFSTEALCQSLQTTFAEIQN